jgi:hypothetical protein
MGAWVQLSTQMIRSSPIECYAAVALSAHDCTPNKKCVLASSVNFLRLKEKIFQGRATHTELFFLYLQCTKYSPPCVGRAGMFFVDHLANALHFYQNTNTLNVSLGSFRLEL